MTNTHRDVGPGTRPDGVAVVVYRDERGTQVTESQLERGLPGVAEDGYPARREDGRR